MEMDTPYAPDSKAPIPENIVDPDIESGIGEKFTSTDVVKGNATWKVYTMYMLLLLLTTAPITLFGVQDAPQGRPWLLNFLFVFYLNGGFAWLWVWKRDFKEFIETESTETKESTRTTAPVTTLTTAQYIRRMSAAVVGSTAISMPIIIWTVKIHSFLVRNTSQHPTNQTPGQMLSRSVFNFLMGGVYGTIQLTSLILLDFVIMVTFTLCRLNLISPPTNKFKTPALILIGLCMTLFLGGWTAYVLYVSEPNFLGGSLLEAVSQIPTHW